MDWWGPLPALGIMVLWGRLFSRTALFRDDLAAATRGKHLALYGLRGLLCLAIVLFHAAFSRELARSGRWGESGPLPDIIGSLLVALFFAMSGYLFWAKLLHSGGRLDAVEFLSSRFRRLAPPFYTSMAVMFLVALVQSGFVLHVPLPTFILQMLRQLGFGVWFRQELNGLPHSDLINAGVTWSFAYEWAFYLLLPFFGVWAFWPRALVAIALPIALQKVFHLPSDVIGFSGGIAAALLLFQTRIRAVLERPRVAAALFSSGILLAMLRLVSYHAVFSQIAVGLILTGVLGGCDVFGFLRSRAMCALGMMSYSAYLFHGIVLWVGLTVLGRFTSIASLSYAAYWSVIAVLAVVIMGVSTIVYALVEKPFATVPRGVRAPRREAQPSS